MNHSASKHSVRIVNPDGLMPRGISDFAKMVQQQRCFVDKSLLIQDIVHCDDDIILITRPRRFGKTMNMSMLQHFFAKQQEQEGGFALFTELLIAQNEQAMQHSGKYPVIALTFKDIKSATWEEACKQLCRLIHRELERHLVMDQVDATCLLPSEQKELQRMLQNSAEPIEWKNSLQLLCKLLTLHYKQAPWLLLDEYDTPIHAAYVQSQKDQEEIQQKDSYYSQMIDFMRSLLGMALKGNDTYLHKAVITGILRVAKEDIFSDLNNLGTYGVMDWRFDHCFGFTQAEVDALFEKRSLSQHLSTAQQWYDGYIFGRQEIYNPWSIVSFISNLPQPAQEYWVNTGSSTLVGRLITAGSAADRQAVETLLLNNTVQRDVSDNLALRELEGLGQALWSILLTSGYITAVDTQDAVVGKLATLCIPNHEVRKAFQRLALQWFKEAPDNALPEI
ncbi:MAG: AAA family ATPase [Myxococcota bacterium]